VVNVGHADRHGNEGQRLPAKGAGVAPGRPVGVDLRLGQAHRERGAVAAQPLGQGDDVRIQVHPVEGEVPAGAADGGLDVVDDEQRTDLLGEVLDLVQPFAAGDVDPALGLD